MKLEMKMKISMCCLLFVSSVVAQNNYGVKGGGGGGGGGGGRSMFAKFPVRGDQPAARGFDQQPAGFDPQPAARGFDRQPMVRPFNPQSADRGYEPQPAVGPFNPQSADRGYEPQPAVGPFNPQSADRGYKPQPAVGPFNPQSADRGYKPQPAVGPFNPQSADRGYEPQPAVGPFNPQSADRGYDPQSSVRGFDRQPQPLQPNYVPQRPVAGVKGGARRSSQGSAQRRAPQSQSFTRTSNPCDQPPKKGPCRASFPRFAFNRATQKCEEFTYGGCQGNQNNFEASEDCVKTCGAIGVTKKKIIRVDIKNPAVCDLPKEQGPCYRLIPKFFYNKQTGKCEEFIYGGCGGNENSFNLPEECLGSCPQASDDVVRLPTNQQFGARVEPSAQKAQVQTQAFY